MRIQQPILKRAVSEGGFYHQLRHNAVAYFDRTPDHLVVTFDDLTLAGKKRDVCWGEDYVRKHKFSHLGILAGRRDWYGEADLEAYLETLAKEGFFSQFMKVTFYGVSMGAFAALAFSRLVPGAIVVAFSPQTTLDPRILPKEDRWPIGTKLGNWNSRKFADAATGLEGAGRVYVLSDPFDPQEVSHISRIPNLPHVHKLSLWHCGHFILSRMSRWSMSSTIIVPLLRGELDSASYYMALRDRRQVPQWTSLLLGKLTEEAKFDRALRLVDWAEKNTDFSGLGHKRNRIQRAKTEHANASPRRRQKAAS